MIPIQNGINLHMIPTKKFKTVCLAMLLRRPLQKEETTINALIPGLLRRGSQKYPGISPIYRHTEHLYGAIFDADIIKKGEEQIIQLFIEVINQDGLVFEAVDFLYEIAARPLLVNGEFEPGILDGEKENLRTVIHGRLHDKKEYAKLRCVEEMFQTEPFGLYGDGYLDQLDAVGGVYAHYQNILKQSPIEFICVGDVDEQALAEKLRRDFVLERESVIQIPPASFARERGETKTVFEDAGVLQAKLCAGLRTGVAPVGDDFYRLLVANEVLGGGGGSKLFNVIREEQSLCYYIHSFVYRFKTAVLIQSGIQETDYEQVLALIQNGIEAVKNGHISGTEFENAVQSLLKRVLGMQDYPMAVMDFYLTQYMLGDGDDAQTTAERIKAVRKEELPRVFQNIWTDTVYMLKGGETLGTNEAQ